MCKLISSRIRRSCILRAGQRIEAIEGGWDWDERRGDDIVNLEGLGILFLFEDRVKDQTSLPSIVGMSMRLKNQLFRSATMSVLPLLR